MTGRAIDEDQIVDPAKAQAMQAPPRPWEVGKHKDYSCFRIRVLVAEAGDVVWSDHELEAPEDEKVLHNLLSGGLRQAAYALFTEGMRKEAMYTILLKLQNDPTFEKKVVEATSISEIEKIEREIAYVVANTLTGELQKNAHAIAREALESVKLAAGAEPQ